MSNAGMLIRALGNHEAAFGDYNAAIKIDPNDIDAYRNRGLLYAWQGKRDLARADYEQGLKLSPNDQVAQSI